MICPCKGCADRTVTCHGVCRSYQEWKKEHEEKKQWLRDQMPVANERAIKGQNKKIMSKARGIGGKRGTKNYE